MVMDTDFESAIAELSQRLAAELAQRTRALLDEANAEISHLREALALESQRRELAEAQLAEVRGSRDALRLELQQERHARQQADQELDLIAAAIDAQLAVAEQQTSQEAAARQAAEAERERRWHDQLASVRVELTQERLIREQLQKRIEALRVAAADLFGSDLPVAAAAPLPETLSHPLAC